MDLLKSAAALDHRTEVNQSDYKFLLKLCQNFKWEALLFDREELESPRKLAQNQLAVLTEFITYGRFTIKQLCADYDIPESSAYRVMNALQDLWIIVDKNPTTYAPSEALWKKLKELRLV